MSGRVEVAGVYVDNLSEDEALARIDELIEGGGSHYMTVVNAAKVVAARSDERLRKLLQRAAVVTADGMSVVWAARLLGEPLKQRVTGIDMFERLVGHAARRGLTVYFLGARDSSVRGAVEYFTTRLPDLRVAGYRDGYFDRTESDKVADEIRESRADLLFVAMGSPAQENWIERHLEATGARFALGVGGSFDHLSGLQRRAPAWMQRSGLEWLHRLAREPRRLWRRYLIGNTVFVWLVFKQMLSRGR
ncbi:MAG TPA: WecB/TagA/CpsF family glycosyltransferase [Blastocatellia bacterium]|nr:WecB/TagA/CpsF family glycosyltransferase [Blastocatellia bacterium]